MRSVRPRSRRYPTAIRILLAVPVIINHVNRKQRDIDPLALDVRVLWGEDIGPSSLFLHWLLRSPPPPRQRLLTIPGRDNYSVLRVLVLKSLIGFKNTLIPAIMGREV